MKSSARQERETQIITSLSLEQCLECSFTESQLDIDSLFKCHKCGNLGQAYVKTSIWKPAKVLILHLKRFKRTLHGYFIFTLLL